MIGILIAAHGDFAKGLVSAAEVIMGVPENTDTVGLHLGDAPDEFYAAVDGKIAALLDASEGDGVIVLADLFGGTPCNTVARIMNERGLDKVRCVTGASLPMLIEVAGERDYQDLAALEDTAMAIGPAGVVSVATRFFPAD